MKSWIILKGMNFFAHHGVIEQERICGNKFTVNLKLAVNLSTACKTDNLNDTINYAVIYQLISNEMAISSNLIEHVSMRIVRRIFEQYPQVDHINLIVEKHNPPMNADINSAGIELDCKREEII